MVSPRSLWLLFVCLLSWCCDAQELGLQDPDSEPGPLPLVIWSEIENTISMNVFKKIVEKAVPGIYVLPMEIGKTMMKDVENKVLDASSEVCQILAQDPRLQEGYIAVAFSKSLKFLRLLAQRCPIPVMRDVISVSARRILRGLKRFLQVYQTPANGQKTNS